MKYVYLASLLTCAVALAGCGGGASSPMPTTPTPTPGGATPTVSIPMGAASLGTAAYVPDSINVAVGTTVKWTNNDVIAHNVTSQNNLFHSDAEMAPGATYTQMFQSAGT